MGTWIRNFLVPVAAAETADVRATVVRWFERRGFDRLPPDDLRAGLFEDEVEDERAVFLVSNSRWSVVVYPRAMEEGDRLLMELARFPVVLETAIFDSDTWTYELHEAGHLTVAFKLGSGVYSDEPKLPVNGDPERLCAAIGVGRADEIRRIQRRRGLMADSAWREFCARLDAEAATVHPQDLRTSNGGRKQPYPLAGWIIEPLFFAKAARSAPSPLGRLHNLVPPARDARPEASPDLDEDTKRQLRTAQLLGVPIRALIFLLTPLFWILGRVWLRSAKSTVASPLTVALYQQESEDGFEGGALLNRRYGFKLRAEGPGEDEARPIRGLHGFVVDEAEVAVRVLRPEQLGQAFRAELAPLADEKFFIGPHPARYSAGVTTTGHERHAWYIELPHVIVVLEAHARSSTQLARATIERIREVVSTFEAIDPRPPPA